MNPSPLPSPISPRFEGVQATLTPTPQTGASRRSAGIYWAPTVPGSGLRKTHSLLPWKSQPRASDDIQRFKIM